MDVVLVPGAWLDASSWDAVAPLLEAQGHHVNALTLPGMEGHDADRSAVRLADQVAAVVAAIDAATAPVLLVGHSIGSGIAQQALDQGPDRVARIVHVGGFEERRPRCAARIASGDDSAHRVDEAVIVRHQRGRRSPMSRRLIVSLKASTTSTALCSMVDDPALT